MGEIKDESNNVSPHHYISLLPKFAGRRRIDCVMALTEARTYSAKKHRGEMVRHQDKVLVCYVAELMEGQEAAS